MKLCELPSGLYVNLRHVVTIEPLVGGATLRLAVPNYDRNPDHTGGTDLMTLHLSRPDAAALLAYLDDHAMHLDL